MDHFQIIRGSNKYLWGNDGYLFATAKDFLDFYMNLRRAGMNHKEVYMVICSRMMAYSNEARSFTFRYDYETRNYKKMVSFDLPSDFTITNLRHAVSLARHFEEGRLQPMVYAAVLDGKNMDAIAEEFNISVNTVKKLYNNAKRTSGIVVTIIVKA